MPLKAREENKDLYGPFALRQSQKYSLDVLSELIGTLLRENNLFDLKEVLNSKTGCESLIVVIKNKLEKEFTMLQFPDPIRKSEFSPVAFVSKKNYDRRGAKDDNERSRTGKDRDVYCHNFAVFIIRFTVLLSAVIASVAYQRNVIKRLLNSEAVGATAVENKTYKPLKDQSMYLGAIAPDILSELKDGGLHQIPDDPRPLYVFNNDDSIVMDVNKGIIYNAHTGPTGVLGIKINRIAAGQVPQVPQVPGYAAAPAVAPAFVPAPIQAPAPAIAQAPVRIAHPAQPQQIFPQGLRRVDPNLVGRNNVSGTGSNISNLGRPPLAGSVASGSSAGVKTRKQRRKERRKGRRTTRRRRTQYGGGDDFTVSLYTVVDCAKVGCYKVAQFIMEKNGMTRMPNESLVVPLAQRVAGFLNSQSARIPLMTDDVENKFKIYSIDDSYSIINDYKEAILGKKNDITSPAFYRATLLAAGVDENTVSTFFCSDAWDGIMTNTVPYALLQSLYYDMDQNGGTMSPAVLAELQTTVDQFIGNNVAVPVDPTAASPPTEFSNLKFVAPKTIATEFCKVSSGIRNTNLPQQKTILTKAHRDLRDLYDAHLETTIQFIRKVLTLKEIGYGKPVAIRINPIFLTNPKGADDALEMLVREARKMLSAHYLKVETVYKKAITDISQLGNAYKEAPVESNTPVVPKPNIPNPQEVREPLVRGARGPQNEPKNNL